jgi:CBS domain-containing protein
LERMPHALAGSDHPLLFSLLRRETDMKQIKEIMSRDVQVISPDMTVAEAARRMRDGNFGMLPVGENDKLVGAITDRDIAVRCVAQGLEGDALVRDVMSDGIRWAYEDESVEHASDVMGQHQIRRLPIVNRDKRLVGIVALADIATCEPALEPAAKALECISEPA